MWKIGELARRAGVTVRTLHHYDRIGLLRPVSRTTSNYREYGDAEVMRLQQIVSLRQMGLSLDEVSEYLDDPESTALEVIERHLARTRERVAAGQALCDRLERLAGRLRSAERVSADELFLTMEMTTMFEKYYTPEQMKQIERRAEEVGEERIHEVEAEWPRLMEEVRAEMERGTDPSDARVQALARRWQALVEEFTGGDPGISTSLRTMYETEDEVQGMDLAPIREMGAYVQRALEAGE